MWGSDWRTLIWGGVTVPLLGPGGLLALAAALLATAWLARRRHHATLAGAALLCAVVAIPLAAVAVVSLPHTLSNGTVADADEVNQNFETIVGDSARYQLTVVGASAGFSAPVPASVIVQLCEDDDGCTVRLFSQDRSQPFDLPFATGPYRFQHNALSRWSASDRATLLTQATDADGNINHVAQTGSGCFFTDAEYVGFSGSDAAPGFNLLLWNGGVTNPNRKCQLTITDWRRNPQGSPTESAGQSVYPRARSARRVSLEISGASPGSALPFRHSASRLESREASAGSLSCRFVVSPGSATRS